MDWWLSEWFKNCYLKYLFIIFLKQYVKLRSENMGVYCHWLILFIIFIIYLLSWTCRSSKRFENSFFSCCFFYYL